MSLGNFFSTKFENLDPALSSYFLLRTGYCCLSSICKFAILMQKSFISVVLLSS